MVDRLLGGEQLEVLKDMAGLQDLDTLWANPSAAYKMLQGKWVERGHLCRYLCARGMSLLLLGRAADSAVG